MELVEVELSFPSLWLSMREVLLYSYLVDVDVVVRERKGSKLTAKKVGTLIKLSLVDFRLA